MPAKPIDIKPVTGFMDARSTPDEVALNGYRYVQNFGVTQKNKLCRIPGFDKLLTRSDYNNQDLHDQLQGITGQSSRLPVTFLFEAISTRKSTKLICGTGKALYALNNSSGNWTVLSDRLGASGARWKAAQIQDVVLFTNNVDEPQAWVFDQPSIEANAQSVTTVKDLHDILKITKVGTVVAWQGHLFLMNIVQAGQVRSNTIYWCSFQKPLSWVESASSTAGNFDLDYGETILGAEELGAVLLVYTNKGIWEGQVISSDAGPVFTFAKRYSPADSGENCLFYPNTLVSVGNEHLYAGVDGIYLYNLFLDKPKLVDWMHKASALMFDVIDRDNCRVHVAAYNADRKEILFSFAEAGQSVPSRTLVFNTEFPFSYVLDYGFSAMVTYVLKEPILSVRQFLLNNCICQTVADYNAAAPDDSKDGGFCTAQTDPVCPNPPLYFWSNVPLMTAASVTTEDYTGDSTSDSLCAHLDFSIGELCESELRADECNSGKRFVVASSSDFCLKELSQNYYREECAEFTGCGTYSRRGYQSVLRSGPLAFNDYRDDKEFRRLEVEAISEFQSTPSLLNLRVGYDAQASDPNEDACGILWDAQDTKEIECLSDVSLAQHRANNTRPNTTYEWPLYNVGRYLFWELKVTNPSQNPPDTGGSVCVSRITVDVNVVGRQYP